jgi:shikimate kinase
LDEVADALAAREPLYREVADVAIDTATADAAAVAERILSWLGSDSPEGAA